MPAVPRSLAGGGAVETGDGQALGPPGAAQPGTGASGEGERAATLRALRAAGPSGAATAQIAAAARLDAGRADRCLAELLADGSARQLLHPAAYVASEIVGDILARVVDRLLQRQRERPWLLGLTSLALAQALAIGESALVRVLASCVEAGALQYRGGYYATADFVPQLNTEQLAFFEAVFVAEPGAPPAPLAYETLRERIKSSPVAELGPAFETLVATGALSKVGAFVYRGADLARIRGQLEAELRREGHVTVAQFRTLTGTSRKYAVPLLEFFDATGVTLRRGDVRVPHRPNATR